jgi:hypothetical protein
MGMADSKDGAGAERRNPGVAGSSRVIGRNAGFMDAWDLRPTRPGACELEER